MRTTRHIFSLMALAAALAMALPACSGDKTPPAVAFPDSLSDDEVIATVNTEKITGRDLRVFTLVYQPNLTDSLHSRMFNIEILNGYIDRALLFQQADAGGIVVDDSTSAWFIDQFEQSMGGTARVGQFLKAAGISREELESTIRRDLMVRSFIENRLGSGITISDADARAYYDENPDRFATEPKVHARHIIIMSQPGDSEQVRSVKNARLAKVLNRARAGEDFSQLAKQNSEGPSAAQGGDLGFFARDEMVKSFSDAAFAMKPGEISDIIESKFGIHIIKVEERQDAGVTSYEDVQDQLIEGLHQRALGSELENNLKRNRDVAIIEPNFDFGGLTQRESATFTR